MQDTLKAENYGVSEIRSESSEFLITNASETANIIVKKSITNNRIFAV